MMEMYGRAIVEERLRPQRYAEIARYVRNEYGRASGPEFLLADMANDRVAGKPRKHRTGSSAGVIRTLVKAVRALVPRNAKAKAASPTR